MPHLLKRYWVIFIFSAAFFVAVAFVLRSLDAATPPLHFALMEHNGRLVTERDFSGTPALLFFGFTRCQDICPMMLGRLSDIQKTMAASHQRIKILFITTDPEHDRPQVMADYIAPLKADITGLTGAKEALEPIYASYKIYPGKVSATDGTADHSGLIYLLDSNGNTLTHFTAQTSASAMMSDITTRLTPIQQRKKHYE